MKYTVLLQSLRRSMRSHETQWVRDIDAPDIVAACNIAIAKFPNLGITPTTVSMCWPQHPKKS